jgi:tRNA A58 N-methylase Trm61
MSETIYVLGESDAEVARLLLQHQLHREHFAGVVRAARISLGDTVLDLGAGPGFASEDLAAWVGPAGKVIALER